MDGERLDLTRDYRTGELLATTLRLFLRHSGLFLSVTLLVVAPSVLLVDGVWGRTLWDGPHRGGVGGAAGVVAMILTRLVIPPLVTGLHAVIVRELGDGVTPPIGRALREAAPRFPAAIGAVALYTAGVAAGLLLLIVPGIWIAVHWYFAAQAAVLDRTSPNEALGVSAALVRGRWMETAKALLAGAFAFGLWASIADALAALVHNGVVYVSLITVIEAISLSLTALFGTLLFFTLRVRSRADATLAAV